MMLGMVQENQLAGVAALMVELAHGSRVLVLLMALLQHQLTSAAAATPVAIVPAAALLLLP